MPPLGFLRRGAAGGPDALHYPGEPGPWWWLVRPGLALTHVCKAPWEGSRRPRGKSHRFILEHVMQLLFLPPPTPTPQQGLDRNMLGALTGPNSLRNFTSRF